jgi:hypothetical protein
MGRKIFERQSAWPLRDTAAHAAGDRPLILEFI